MGVFKWLGRVFADTSSEDLVVHLRRIGVHGRVVEIRVKGLLFTRRRKIVELAGERIDALRITEHSRGDEHGSGEMWYHVHYLLRGVAGAPANLSVKRKEIKEHRFWGAVRDVEWVGGPLATRLNGDRDLSGILVQEGQTRIKIRFDRRNRWVDIESPRGFPVSELFPSTQVFGAYSAIAENVRNSVGGRRGRHQQRPHKAV